MQGQGLLPVFGKQRRTWEKPDGLPAAPMRRRGRMATRVCSLLPPLFAFRHGLYLEITNEMLKIKHASKDSFKLYKAIFTLVLDYVLSPLCVIFQKVRDCNLYSNVFKVHVAVSTKGCPKIQGQLLLTSDWKRDSFQK